jgi:hypothetical protein
MRQEVVMKLCRLRRLALAAGALLLSGCATESGQQIRSYQPWFTASYKAPYQSIAACAAREMQRFILVNAVYVDSEKRVLISATAASYSRYSGETLYPAWEAEVRQIDGGTSQVEVKRTASPNENSAHWQTIRDTFDRCGNVRPG